MIIYNSGDRGAYKMASAVNFGIIQSRTVASSGPTPKLSSENYKFLRKLGLKLKK